MLELVCPANPFTFIAQVWQLIAKNDGFFSLHYVALFAFILMLRQTRRFFFHRSPPVGRRTLKRLQQQAPQVLIRSGKGAAEASAFIHGIGSWMQHHKYILRTCYCYYAGLCTTTWTSWLAAAYVLSPTIKQHATTLFECQLLSAYFNCLMAEGKLMQSVWGCILAIECPWFPPFCDRCGQDHPTEQCSHFRLP